MKNFAILVATVLAITGIAILFVYAEGKSETVECNRWAQEADVYPGFYLTQWQADQCTARGVTVNAPVKIVHD